MGETALHGAELTATLNADMVKCVAFSPGGSTLATGSSDANIRLWSVTPTELLFVLSGHTAVVWTCAFSKGGSLLASGSWDTTIILWDPRMGAKLRSLTGHTVCCHGLLSSHS